ncbi:MAG: peptidyl-tRNA hydrolase Pth2 [Methanosarcinaceae archaeon]|nr:peptidyl-tRNA hydrolase Pth2 [Methanosarcinaceae archaeon]
MVEYKQCIVIREDLKLSKGKLAAQVAHAAVSAFEAAKESEKRQWKSLGQKKVVLKVPSLNDLLELKEISRKHKFPTALISDSGLTEIAPGTITVLGIGPANSMDIDKITKHLKLV